MNSYYRTESPVFFLPLYTNSSLSFTPMGMYIWENSEANLSLYQIHKYLSIHSHRLRHLIKETLH